MVDDCAKQNKTKQKRNWAWSQNKVAMKKYYLMKEKNKNKKRLLCLYGVFKVGFPLVAAREREGKRNLLVLQVLCMCPYKCCIFYLFFSSKYSFFVPMFCTWIIFKIWKMYAEFLWLYFFSLKYVIMFFAANFMSFVRREDDPQAAIFNFLPFDRQQNLILYGLLYGLFFFFTPVNHQR